MLAFESTKEFRKGYKAEGVIADLLRQDGCYVVITADLNMRNGNGAPGAVGQNKGFITLPDLDVASKGCRAFVEVKYKSKADFTRITQRLEHGIGYRSFLMYHEAIKEFGSAVFLFVYEADSGAVLYNSIDVLLPDRDDYHIETNGAMNLIYRAEGETIPVARIYTGQSMDAGGMVFFPRSAFSLWGKVSIAGDDAYTQLGLFDAIEGQGDRLFSIIRHNAEL